RMADQGIGNPSLHGTDLLGKLDDHVSGPLAGIPALASMRDTAVLVAPCGKAFLAESRRGDEKAMVIRQRSYPVTIFVGLAGSAVKDDQQRRLATVGPIGEHRQVLALQRDGLLARTRRKPLGCCRAPSLNAKNGTHDGNRA